MLHETRVVLKQNAKINTDIPEKYEDIDTYFTTMANTFDFYGNSPTDLYFEDVFQMWWISTLTAEVLSK